MVLSIYRHFSGLIYFKWNSEIYPEPIRYRMNKLVRDTGKKMSHMSHHSGEVND